MNDTLSDMKDEIVEIRDDLNGITLNISERQIQLRKLKNKYNELISDLKLEISSLGDGIGVNLKELHGLLNVIYDRLDDLEARINIKNKV